MVNNEIIDDENSRLVRCEPVGCLVITDKFEKH